ncbi:ABC transporter ATP-binding protein [Fodinibius sp.]|uniref:ABC transporter ATP-binding protein n=1 Tax=Fodinibius sp. TaxID=1872440 RepID=UPI002ACD7532|nr:ATP-binding cassette domain-containing protein [Fodinibius sp.]MDZ7658696.1 ATP-binding cassette domain-containing protein [Fodinibius sp.]
MIRLRNISKIFDDQTKAVNDISFHVKKGETFGLIGTSGCGKTTTLKMINRLVEPTSGLIKIDGKDVTSQKPEVLRRRIGYVIQDIGLFPHYTIKENIATVPSLLDWDIERIQARVKELLELVGLSPNTYADRLPQTLSGGQQQRVGLARALAADPPIILMDEPFGALDPITKREIRGEVRKLFEQINKTIVLVTHDIFEAFEMCDRLCLLDDGILQQVGTPRELLFNPANNFVDSFFASNRFQLELLSIRLSDVLTENNSLGERELYWSPPLSEEHTYHQIEEDKPLYNVLEEMEQSRESNIKIIHRIDGKVIDSLGFSDILNRFQTYKKQLKTGGDHG